MQSSAQIIPEPPSNMTLLKEIPNAARDLLQLAHWRWQKQLKQVPQGDGHSVMTIPGFGGGDGSMAILRRFLDKSGYDAQPWELGTNLVDKRVTTMDEILEFCLKKEADIAERLEMLANNSGEKVSLIGWSMGGVFANSLAQTHPDLIRQVITLGAPIGDPRGTSTWNILKMMFRSNVPEELQNVDGWMQRKEGLGERLVRTSILYSLEDGAVSKGSAVIDNHQYVDNIQVPSSHIGFAHNPVVYSVIADRLSQDMSDFQLFDADIQPDMIRNAM